MNDIDPAWLRSFLAIAQHGSVTRAAVQVHRTQSAVSTQLQQLEASLGVQLVQRSTRSLRLTADGERFMPHARRILELQDEARASVQPAREAAVWRIGISEYFFPSRLDELLALLRDAEPGARLELLWTSSIALQALWKAGEADLVVTTSTAPLEGARLLRREPLSWVAAARRPPAPGHAPVPLVLLGIGCPVREIALESLQRNGRAHHIQLSCTGSHGAVAAMRAGWGIGCLNQSAIPADLDVLTRTRPLDWPSPGKLSFYVMAKPELRRTERALRQWATP
jgi:DNA-binding transcriptional LysR family regulator